jgi:hypothetical protein
LPGSQQIENSIAIYYWSSQKNSKNWSSNNLLQNCSSFGCYFMKTADPARVFDQRSFDSEYFQKSETKVL